LLALDLLSQVLASPSLEWAQTRPEFAAQLRQPLALVLLRNCLAPADAAAAAAVRILCAVLASSRLRAGLKAEVGALFPLLLLRPLEADRCECERGQLGPPAAAAAPAHRPLALHLSAPSLPACPLRPPPSAP
jgi:hypothetical protein